MKAIEYQVRLRWSEEDGGYIATVPDLPGCSAFGVTAEEAVREVKVAASLWLETTEE